MSSGGEIGKHTRFRVWRFKKPESSTLSLSKLTKEGPMDQNKKPCEKETDHDFDSSGKCMKCGSHRPPYMPNCS
jgi:hypothetical protein